MRRSLLIGLLLATACTDDLDKIEEVRDLRILAMRADPPEVFIDMDPQVQVTFSALVVDPTQPHVDAAPLTYTFSFCPVESSEGCLDFDARRDDAPADSRPLLESLRGLGDDGVAQKEPQALTPDQVATRGTWPYAILPYTLELAQSETQGLAAYFLQTNFMGFGMGALPSIILDASGTNGTINAEKRFVFNVGDPAALAEQLGASLPYRICDSGEPQENGCVGLRPRIRNSNPSFDRIQVALGAAADGSFFDTPTTGFTMRGSSVIRILPVMTPDSYESYQELVTDPSTGRIFARDITEIISVSWFATEGEVQDALTSPIYTKSLDTEFESPNLDKVPAEGMSISVFMVARDQRGGVAWQNFEIFVTK